MKTFGFTPVAVALAAVALATGAAGGASAAPSGSASDTIGLVDPAQGLWYLRDEAGGVRSFFYGNPGDVPLVGDWDCDGIDTPGMYRRSDGYVYLRNSNSPGVADRKYFLGDPQDVPIAGDFDGDGCDTVSVYRASEGKVYIVNRLGDDGAGLGAAEIAYDFGNPGDVPFAGDFDGDGVDTVGLHRSSTGFVYLRNSHTPGLADVQFFYGDPADRFVAGDWTGDQVDTPGLFRPSDRSFYLRHANTQGVADEIVPWGDTEWLPVAGSFGLPADPVPGGSDVVFTAAGDIGATSQARRVLTAIGDAGADFHLALGDLSYDETPTASAWCSMVQNSVGATHPVEVVVGNHEDDSRVDGFIRDFAACLPDAMGASGDYGVQYAFDVGGVRVIMIAPNLSVDGVDYDYTTGPHRDWLRARIAESEAAGRWTVVGMHENCVTAGVKSCAIGEAMMDDMIARGVDLILQGHEHNYQRSHQLACVDVGVTTPACVVDTDGEFAAGVGAVLAITGWVGRSGYDVDPSDPEAGYFAVVGGPNTPSFGAGFLTITASDTALTGTWTSVDGTATDTFTIRR